MAPQRKRENRENNFYNVGVQGRKTGITLADRGVYDEHGLEALSGIFSSPEKSPPKRGGNITASGSMDIQETSGSIPELTTSHQILRNSRTHLPPPRSRSPKKTMLGSSPRRQSSAAPRGSSVGLSSPVRATSHPTARRLDFEQDESSLQETPALSGSGARRNKRNNVYDIPEDESPAPQQYDTILEESMVQEELANDGSVVFNPPAEESFAEQVGDDTTNDAEVAEVESEQEESEIVPEPVAQPAKRGRKRKSDVIEPEVDAESSAARSRKRGPAAAKTAETQKTSRKDVPGRRRSQRTSDIDEQDPSILNSLLEDSEHASAPAEEAPGPVKRRGRPPRAQPTAEKENAISTKTTKPAKTTVPANDKPESSFRKPEKPAKPAAKPKAKDKLESKVKPTKQSKDKGPQAESEETGKLVDVYGNPLSKQDIERMSVTSTTSRFGRGRHLSVFREIDPDAVARVGRTGRHRVAPIDFWKNESISYSTDGSMTAIVKNQDTEPAPKRSNNRTSAKSKKRNLTTVEEEDVELDPWEAEDGRLRGNYKDFDAEANVTTNDVMEDDIAWAPKGVEPKPAGEDSFYFARLGSASGNWFNWGVIELRPDQMKRSKNSRKMHLVFNVQYGTVEAKIAENEFTVHKNGIWQCPRGNQYSIKNIGNTTARVFFAQACQTVVKDTTALGNAED